MPDVISFEHSKGCLQFTQHIHILPGVNHAVQSVHDLEALCDLVWDDPCLRQVIHGPRGAEHSITQTPPLWTASHC